MELEKVVLTEQQIQNIIKRTGLTKEQILKQQETLD